MNRVRASDHHGDRDVVLKHRRYVPPNCATGKRLFFKNGVFINVVKTVYTGTIVEWSHVESGLPTSHPFMPAHKIIGLSL